MVRRISLFLLLGFLLLEHVLPIQTAATIHTASEPLLITHTQFYKVSKAGRSAFLLGTLHAGISLGEMPFQVQQALRDSQVVAVENVFSRTRLDEMLKGHLPKQDACLAVAFKEWEKPSFISLDLQIEKFGYENHKKMFSLDDRKNLTRAQKLELKSGRCTYEEAFNKEAQLKLAAISTIESYRSGIWKIPSEGTVALRNQSWIPQIEGALNKKGFLFAAVGITHLMGKSGLLEELKNDGYVVERVR